MFLVLKYNYKIIRKAREMNNKKLWHMYNLEIVMDSSDRLHRSFLYQHNTINLIVR